MLFDFSEQQRMLADSVAKALAGLPQTSVPVSGSAEDVSPSFETVAATLGELGLFGLLVPEEACGLGLGMVEAVAVAIEVGRSAVPFPVIETIAAMQVAAGARPDLVEAVLSGEAAFTAPIHGELTAGAGARPTITGTVSLPFADKARYVAAPVAGPAGARRTLLVELNGERTRRTEGIDLTHPLAHVEFARDVSGNELVSGRADELLSILAAAEIVGAAEYCLSKTVAYLKERQQFGKIIGTFQSLKHVAADCQVGLSAMRASVQYAAALHDRFQASGDAADREEAANARRIAKAFCSETGQRIAEQCVQMHGGIAFTWEYGLHIHLRRIARLANAHGTAYENRDELAGYALEAAATPGGLAAERD
jgi:alkylation response protein AidB-like acyl-CoA dehydrogenase